MSKDIAIAGSLILFKSGSYSDKATHGPFHVLKDIDRDGVTRDFLVFWETHREALNEKAGYQLYDDDDAPEIDVFIAYLARNAYIEDAAAYSWYLGDYRFGD